MGSGLVADWNRNRPDMAILANDRVLAALEGGQKAAREGTSALRAMHKPEAS